MTVGLTARDSHTLIGREAGRWMLTQEKSNLAKQLEQAATVAQYFQTEASRLSNRILEFEKWLGQLPGICEVEIALAGNYKLGVHRTGGTWCLLVSQQSGSNRMTSLANANADIKVEAAYNFPALLAELANIHQRKLEKVRQVHSILDGLEQITGPLSAEGR